MRILLTGGSSKIGEKFLLKLLDNGYVSQIYAGVYKRAIRISHPKLQLFPLNLKDDFNLGAIKEGINYTIHFASLSHSFEKRVYWETNFEGTKRLAQEVWKLGCRKFIYISSRCARQGAGDYGESKLAAEAELKSFGWDQLLILRPAEIFGTNGTEGIDRMIQWARKFHIVPAFFGNSEIRFAPLYFEDFLGLAIKSFENMEKREQVIEILGPEFLSGCALAWRIAKTHKALPIPIWIPLMSQVVYLLNRFHVKLLNRDQFSRLIFDRSTLDAGPSDLSLNFRRFQG